MSISNIIGASIVNIGCNFATDMLKSFGKKTWQKTIEKELSKYLEEFVDLDIDSGSFYNYLNTTENKVNFQEFIRFNAYRHHETELDEKRALTKEVFIEKVAKQAQEFVNTETNKHIPIEQIQNYMYRLLQVIEEKLLDTLSPENLSSLYFYKQALSEMEKRIIQSLDQKHLTPTIEQYENIRTTYLKLIKSRSKTSHVYGYDELDLYSFYVFPEFSIEETKISTDHESNTISWIDLFSESNIVSIVGGAGFGKSLFLKNLINKHDDLRIFEANMLLPILCDLKKFKAMSQDKHLFSIKDFLVQSMIDFTGMDERDINKDFLSYFLDAGRCLILFDALDEVDKNSRDELNKKISLFFEVTNQNNKVCITSRASGFTPQTRITYKVNAIDTHEVDEYLDKMISLKFFKKSDKVDFLMQCNELIYNGFLVSFLQLSLLVNIFKAEKELPENKIDLYEKCINYISRKREKDQKKSNFDFKLINTILDNDGSFEKLSSLSTPNNGEVSEREIKSLLMKRYKISYSSENETSYAIDEFLRFCSQRTELYVEGTKEGFYKFYHRSFFEFFYSQFLIKEIVNKEKLLIELVNYDIDSELFELTTSLLKKYYDDRYIEFINELLNYISILNLNSSEDRELFVKYSLMMIPVNEVDYVNEYYYFCFNQEKKLAYHNEEDGRDVLNDSIIFPIILKNKSDNEVMEDCLKFYKEEIILTHFLLHTSIPNLDIKVKLSYIFARFYDRFLDRLDFNQILRETGVNLDNIYSLLSKYIEFENEEYSKPIIIKEIENLLLEIYS